MTFSTRLTLMKYKIQSSVIVFGLLRELKLYNNFNNQPPIMFLLLYDKNVFKGDFTSM